VTARESPASSSVQVRDGPYRGGDDSSCGRSALWTDDGKPVDLASLGVDRPLIERLRAWNARYRQTVRSTILRTMPDEVAERLYTEQPLHVDPPELCVLHLLHKLDLQDKHREMLGTRAAVAKFEYNLRVDTFRIPPQDTNIENAGILAFDLEPDALVLQGQSPLPIRRVHGSMRLTPDVGFARELLIGESVLELLAGLTNQVRAVVHQVEGQLPELIVQMEKERERVRQQRER